MRSNINHDKIIVALKRAIEATFDEGKWLELGYLTDSIEIIAEHPRLLRSLGWGDNDYGGNIFGVLSQIIGLDDKNLAIVEDLVGLEEWLRQNDPNLYTEIYGGELIESEKVEKTAGIHNINELNQQVARIKRSIRDDPALATGSAKEMLETVLKTILGQHGSHIGNDDISSLLKKAQKALGIDPKTVNGKIPGAEKLCRILNNLGQVLIGVAEIRNLLGTGHGKSKGAKIESVHARLVVNAAVTISTFLLEIWEMRQNDPHEI